MPTPETPTLLPCPFCGGEAEMNQAWSYWDVMCHSDLCGVRPVSDGYDTQSEAAAAWNARHVDPATLALARLGAATITSLEMAATPLPPNVEHRWMTAKATPGIRERVAELLQDTEARERLRVEGA
jgi:hypothetical protein